MAPHAASRHVSRVIAVSPQAVYRFAADPGNLPRWAAGLARGEAVPQGDSLLVESPMGTVTVTFTPPNDLGVLDHDVTLPSGQVVTNPLRVLAHPGGAEVIFTIRQLDRTDAELDRDAALAGADLDTLKRLLEQGAAGPVSPVIQ